jgi:hypothetical protein
LAALLDRSALVARKLWGIEDETMGPMAWARSVPSTTDRAYFRPSDYSNVSWNRSATDSDCFRRFARGSNVLRFSYVSVDSRQAAEFQVDAETVTVFGFGSEIFDNWVRSFGLAA